MTNNPLLTGYLTKAELAAALGRSERTIARLMNQPNGLPFVAVGRTFLFNIDRVREWLATRETQRCPAGGRRRRAA